MTDLALRVTARQHRILGYALAHYANDLQQEDDVNGGYDGPLETPEECRVLYDRIKNPAEADGIAEFALDLLEYALHLRMYGEKAPGGNETWAEWETRTEAFLRRVKGLAQ